MLFVFCPWNSEEFRARVAAAKLMNILWAKDPGGFKKSWRTMKKGFPHGCLGFFWGDETLLQLCGDSNTPSKNKGPHSLTRIQWKVSEVNFFVAQVSVFIPNFFNFRLHGSHGGSLIPDHWDISTFDSLNVVGFFPFHKVFPLSCSCYKCL